MSACQRGHRWPQALELLSVLKEQGIESNTVIYNSAISACEKAGEWQAAACLLHLLIEAGLQADAITYSAAMTAFSDQDHRETGFNIPYVGRGPSSAITRNRNTFHPESKVRVSSGSAHCGSCTPPGRRPSSRTWPPGCQDFEVACS